ncbi:MAG: LEPR-XLL domain-containing protein [Phycisphaera sp.]|nr:LEPR-XLL domain-containing protein [Phycisphaera sp.]
MNEYCRNIVSRVLWLSRSARRHAAGASPQRPTEPLFETLESRVLLSAVMSDLDAELHALPVVDESRVVETGTLDAATAGVTPEGLLSTVPLSETFTLHSNPGASKVIYLDFDGHITSGTIWNSNFNGGADIVTPAYDIDGDPSTFTNTELQRIQYIWQRVAEDYIPFDVDVTTQDPGSAALINSGGGDTDWGVRVAIGGSSYDWYGAGAGGVAYVGSFNWNSDSPCFVFDDQLGNGGEKYVAEAASHEAGHTLGLSHDGTSTQGYYDGQGAGETAWAPIMGVGYYVNLTQFSKGEYFDANQHQDDLAIITSNNGFGYRADDHGSTTGSADALNISGTSVSDGGIIERNTDYDVFAFVTGAGDVSFDVTPALRGANLDILAELLNSAGTVIASANPTGVLAASLSASLAAGSYFLRVSGVGQGDPMVDGYSDYASLGQYAISGSIVDSGPTFSVNDVTVNEADGTATFTVSLSQAQAATVGVDIATANGSAVAGSDFTAKSATLSFAPGVTTKTFSVAITDDTAVESTETFVVVLSNATGGVTIADGSGVGTIIDNDLPPITASVADASVNERDLGKGKHGGAQVSTMTFTVTLSRPADSTVTIHYATADGSATAGVDYVAKSGTLTIAAGQSSGTISVDVLGDTAVEGNETFTLQLSNASGATLVDAVATGTIVDNDTGGGGGGGGGKGGGKPGRKAAVFADVLADAAPADTGATNALLGLATALNLEAPLPSFADLFAHSDSHDPDSHANNNAKTHPLSGVIDLLASA